MKKLNLIIQIVLALAIIGLYVMHFTCRKSNSCTTTTDTTKMMKPVVGNIVYVNIDTVIHNYEMYQDLKEQLTGKQKQLESEMNSKSKNYQSGVMDYQNKVQKGLVTRAAAAEMEQQLSGEQQKLLQMRDQYQMQLAEEEQVMNRQILNSIMEYLTEYNKTKGYQFILGNSFGGNVLYADKNLNITQEVLIGINKVYKEQKSKTAGKK